MLDLVHRPAGLLARAASCLGAALAAVLLAPGPPQASASTLPTYVVQPGDTLWGIAEEDGLSVDALAAANGMRPTDLLITGRVLLIPPQNPGRSTEGWLQSPGRTPPRTTAGVLHTGTLPSAGGGSSGGVLPSGGATCPAVTGIPAGVIPPLLAVSPDRLAIQPLFVEWSEAYGVDPALVEAVAWQESGWQANVVSADGAMGIGQLLPSTVQFTETQLLGATLDPWSAADNIQMTARLLAYLAAREGGNLCATIAAYYQGAAAVQEFGVLPVSVPYIADVEALMTRFG